MTERVLKINSLFKKEIGKIILEEVDFPDGVLATITGVDTFPNLIESRIYISCFPEDQIDTVLRILKSRVYDIQQKMNKKLNMRPVPKIVFLKEDRTIEADRVEGLLEELKKEEK